MTLSGPPRAQARLVSAQEPRMTCLLSAAHWARDTHVSPHVYLCCPGECGPAPAPAPPPRTAPPPTRPHCAPARPRGCCCPAPRALEDVVTTCHVSRVQASVTVPSLAAAAVHQVGLFKDSTRARDFPLIILRNFFLFNFARGIGKGNAAFNLRFFF